MQLPWFIVNLVVMLGVLSWVYKRSALKQMSYSRHFSKETVFEGEDVEMVELIVNRKPLPLPWVRLESLIERGLSFSKQTNLDIRSGELYQNHISLFSLRPYRQIVRRHKVQCFKRGYYRLDSATMTAGDPFGFVTTSKRFPLSLELLVYPGTVPLADLPLPNHSWLGDIAVRRWIVEDPFLTAGVREYRPGDPLQAVNWKATARAGALQVHKKDFTADHRLMICLNLEVSETMWKAVIDPERIEQGIRYAASVAVYALNNGIETGFLCNGWMKGKPKQAVRIDPAGGTEQIRELLETMAKLELETAESMSWMLEREISMAATDMDFLVITCHQGDKLRENADELKRLGNGLEWMIIPG
ncbi:DUF58 domain-containing protein [Paenibacillus alkalitolerans]|uniref:DUF58 domain-containing protein n=1 Tax=Paenibacillus alkalitolerans TaxID=2799335 RepID=UPI0018F37EDA|nr:DUF58 domain-containing protein [Paenibacillus alkalitolerans]